MPPETIARRATVRGHVQGVFFRAHVAEQARRHGVSGWAANRGDGTVEVHAEGPADGVRAVLDACRTGPDRARVDGVDEREAPAEGATGFTTR
jgi:acylphosphatase